MEKLFTVQIPSLKNSSFQGGQIVTRSSFKKVYFSVPTNLPSNVSGMVIFKCTLIETIYLIFLEQVDLTECSCSNACSELEYESRVSYSKFPDDSLINILQRMATVKHSSDYMR